MYAKAENCTTSTKNIWHTRGIYLQAKMSQNWDLGLVSYILVDIYPFSCTLYISGSIMTWLKAHSPFPISFSFHCICYFLLEFYRSGEMFGTTLLSLLWHFPISHIMRVIIEFYTWEYQSSMRDKRHVQFTQTKSWEMRWDHRKKRQ